MRQRHADQRRASIPATQIRYDPNEAPMERHDRRLSMNLEQEGVVRAWADEQGLALLIRNKGHHWTFQAPGFVAEWWPSSAKLVLNKQWDRGIHVHDWPQARHEISRKMPKQRQPSLPVKGSTL